MKLFLAALSLLLAIALICSPLYLVYIGFVGPNISFWVRVGLVVIGLVLHLYHHGQGLESVLETNPAYFLLQPLLVTMGDEGLQVIGIIAMKDAVDGVVTGDVLYLTSAEVIKGG